MLRRCLSNTTFRSPTTLYSSHRLPTLISQNRKVSLFRVQARYCYSKTKTPWWKDASSGMFYTAFFIVLWIPAVLYKFTIKDKDVSEEILPPTIQKMEEINPDYKIPKENQDTPLNLIFDGDEGFPTKAAVVFQLDGRVWEAKQVSNLKVFRTEKERKIVWAPFPSSYPSNHPFWYLNDAIERNRTY